MHGFDLRFDGTRGYGDEVRVRFESENAAATSRESDGVFVEIGSFPETTHVFLSKADARAMRDALNERYPVRDARNVLDEVGDLDGVRVFVTGDSDDWSHGFEVGAQVEILPGGDDVPLDGSYHVRDVETGISDFVGANDLDLERPTITTRDGLSLGDEVTHSSLSDSRGVVEEFLPRGAVGGDVLVRWTRGAGVAGTNLPALQENLRQTLAAWERELLAAPARFMTGIDPDPSVAIWADALKPSRIMAIPEPEPVRPACAICGGPCRVFPTLR